MPSPRVKKRNKPYKPKKVEVQPSIWGLKRSAKTTNRLVTRAAVEGFVQARPEPRDWYTIADALNLANVLAERHHYDNPEYDSIVAVIQTAIEAMNSIKHRFWKTKKIGWSGGERSAILPAIDLCEDLIDSSTRREQLSAIDEVQKRCAVIQSQAQKDRQNGSNEQHDYGTYSIYAGPPSADVQQ